VLAIGATATGAAAMAATDAAEPGTPAALTNTCSPPPPPAPRNSEPPSEPGVRQQMRLASVAVRGADPAQDCHHGPGPASGDPNQNTDPQYSDLFGPASDTTRCSSTCHVSVDLSDALFDLTATSQGGGASAVEADTGGTPVLFATRDGGGDRPACPGYRSTFVNWAQFGFTDPSAGRRFRKTATFTLRRAASRADATATAAAQQVCLEAPYRFDTRPGFALGGSGGVFDGVLPDCAGAAVRGPCVVSRSVVQDNGGRWHTRVVFAMPPNAKDPKALG
jgi:hypothetical protein